MKRSALMTCPVARTAALIGMPWTLVILRDLFVFKTRRYQDLLFSLEGISPNTLANRLKQLEQAGVVERKAYQDHPVRYCYRLTRKGRDLGPVLLAMKAWGEKHKGPVAQS